MRKDPGSSIQIIGVVFVVLLAAVLVGRSVILSNRKGMNQGPLSRIQFKLLLQEAAIPGKRIQGTEGNATLFTYICKPDDAAIALLTIHPPRALNGDSASARLAIDEHGNNYVIELNQVAPETFLAIVKAGFAKRPAKIEARIVVQGSSGAKDQGFAIEITKIAEPRRIVPELPASKLAENEKVARADFDLRSNRIMVKCLEKIPADETEVPAVLSTTFGARYFPLNPSTYQSGIDSAIVRLIRFRNEASEKTFTYRNARIIRTGGKNFLLLPKEEVIGSILGHDVTLRNLAPAGSAKPSPNSESGQDLELEYKNKGDLPQKESGSPDDGQAQPRFEVLGMTPDLGSMGIRSLHIYVRPSSVAPLSGSRLLLSAKTNQNPDMPQAMEVPELKFSLRVTVINQVGSRTLTLPVHHDLASEARSRNLFPRPGNVRISD